MFRWLCDARSITDLSLESEVRASAAGQMRRLGDSPSRGRHPHEGHSRCAVSPTSVPVGEYPTKIILLYYPIISIFTFAFSPLWLNPQLSCRTYIVSPARERMLTQASSSLRTAAIKR